MKHSIFYILAISVAMGGPLVSQPARSTDATDSVTTIGRAQLSRLVNGEVLTVDDERSKIVIKHQELEDLGMPAMTMVFNVPDKSLLKGIIAGCKIKFAAQVAHGGLSVVKLEAVNN